ncbi:hypothetical protein MMC17_001111 [Xylographa soralifera]|nr:hypothetical protein [Xylographa soralifera]
MEMGERLPVKASLALETKGYLQGLAPKPDLNRSTHRGSMGAGDSPLASSAITQQLVDIRSVPTRTQSDAVDVAVPMPKAIAIEVPLVNDSTFFQMLTRDMSRLDALHLNEETELSANICDLGEVVTRLAPPSQSGEKTDLQPWQDIFSLYNDSGIFFSTKEQDQFNRTPAMAQEQMQSFLDKLKDLGLSKKFQKQGSHIALRHFIAINVSLLKHLKFQELNLTARMKILKKFDKRTALSARQIYLDVVPSGAFCSVALAKAVCSQICNKLLATIPQLNDYLCPVCQSIAWKPIRLRCGHVFCIRCMLTMLKVDDDRCPFCRTNVIRQADSRNLDQGLMNLLCAYFPREVRAKQKENERQLATDQFGKDSSIKCQVM